MSLDVLVDKVRDNFDQHTTYFLGYQINTKISLGTEYKNFTLCEVQTENSVPRVSVRHHEACRVMPNSCPRNRFFSALNTQGSFFILVNILI